MFIYYIFIEVRPIFSLFTCIPLKDDQQYFSFSAIYLQAKSISHLVLV